MKRLFAPILFTAALALSSAHGAAASIPVTQTWAQLKAAPVLDVATPWGPAKVRLGLEHSRTVVGRTIAIFALVEGPNLEPYDTDYDRQLGPLIVDVREQEARHHKAEVALDKMQREKRVNAEKKPFQLYALLLPLQLAERYTATARLPGGPVLAEAELIGEPGWSHPWTRLRLPEDSEAEREEQVAGDARANAVYADWEICYPRVDGTTPVKTFTVAELAAASGPLPRADGPRRPLPLPDYAGAEALKHDDAATAKLIAQLIPQLGDADFETRERAAAILHALLPAAVSHLKAARFSTVDTEARTRLEALLEAAEAYTLKLTAEKELWTLEFSAPREFGRYSSIEKILTRWWINGKPVVKTAAEEPLDQMRDTHERINPESVWKIDLKADYAWLGARPGDSVSVQILYAPCGVKDFSMLKVEESQAIDCESSILPLLSNISTFTYQRK
jgi:hypothetical protein